MKTLLAALLFLSPVLARAQTQTPTPTPAPPPKQLPGLPTKVTLLDKPLDAILDDGAQIVAFSQQYGNLFYVLSYKGKSVMCSVAIRLPDASSNCLQLN